MTSPLSFRPCIRTFFLSLAAAITLALGSIAAVAQQPTQSSSPVDIRPDASEPAHSWTIEQLLPLTVSEAWQMSGKNEDKFFDMVQDLAAFSAKRRNLTLPASEQAGHQAGEYIKEQAKMDRDQLLYAVVDQAVRKVGTPASAQTSAATPQK
jgi:hypothetical protein